MTQGGAFYEAPDAIPWAGACVHCRRAIQADDPWGAWIDADGRSECLGTTSRHEPEVPPVIEDVAATRTIDQPGWVKRQTSAGWIVPEGWRFENLGACRTCGTPVAWCWTKAGNRAPVEKDGTPHFARCPQASQHRRR